MAASALNPLVAACLLALVVAAGAARIVPEGTAAADPDALTTRSCHSNNGWSGHLCEDVCKVSGFSRYDFAVANTATGEMATCCCCPKSYKNACLNIKE